MLFYRNPEKYFRGCHVRIGLFEGSELIYDDDVKWSLILIADTFYSAGFIEHWGRGIKRICDECKDNDMQNPRFEIIASDFAIIFKANYKYDYGNLDNQNDTNQTNQTHLTKLTKEEQKMMNIIIRKPEISQKELAETLDWTLASVKYYSIKLQQKNVISREGTNRKGKWIIL